jgi:hypothetical protein
LLSLVRDDLCIPRIVVGNHIVIRFGQFTNAVSEATCVAVIDLKRRRGKFGIVKRTGRNLDLIIVEVFKAQRCSEIATESTLTGV